MFNHCLYLEEFFLSSLKTDNVNDMNNMFYNCVSLKELNVSNFNTKM